MYILIIHDTCCAWLANLSRVSPAAVGKSFKAQWSHSWLNQQHRTRRKGSYTPCTEGNLQSAPTTQKWDSEPMVHPAHWPTAQCKQSEKGTHALSARTAPRVLRGSYPPWGARPGPPKGSPGSGPLVPPEPTMATHTVGPPTRGARHQPMLTTAPPTGDVLPLKASRPSPC